METLLKCTYCGDDLDDDEADNPYKDDCGHVMCDECFRDKYEDICERCCDVVLKTDLATEPGKLIAAWTDAPGSPDDLTPGYYRVKEWPIYVDYMIGGHMYSDHLERVADLDADGERASKEAFCACGPLCTKCQGEIEAALPSNVFSSGGRTYRAPSGPAGYILEVMLLWNVLSNAENVVTALMSPIQSHILLMIGNHAQISKRKLAVNFLVSNGLKSVTVICAM